MLAMYSTLRRLKSFWPISLLALLFLSPLLFWPEFILAEETVIPAESSEGENHELPPSPPLPLGFTFADVEKEAQLLASQPFVSPDQNQVEFLKSIPQDKWQTINFQELKRLWGKERLPFEVGLFHPGFIFDQPPSLHIVKSSEQSPQVQELPFSTDYFTYTDDELKEDIHQADLNFAGFRLNYPLHHPERKDEVLSFLGATHFRGVGRHSRYGLEARGLIINPAHEAGEEFPYFRRFWLVEPESGTREMTIYALLDSPSFTGAYRFVVTPGPSTIMDIRARFYLREGREMPDKIGLSPLGSMYLHSEKEGPQRGDWRPEVHNSDILLWTGADEKWHQRPLSNPARLQINSFQLNNPAGFGLMQQDGNFDHYQDLEARFDLRSSVWVEPEGNWGDGHLELIEIPSANEINNNIILYWVPESKPEKSFQFDYKLYWMLAGAIPHQNGRAVATRQTQKPDGTTQFIVDFEGGLLDSLNAESALTSVVETFPSVPVTGKALVKNPVTGGWRLTFSVAAPELKLVESILSARGGSHSLRLTALLKKGENIPEPLTEIWTYDLPY